MSAAPRARSAATTPWRRPTLLVAIGTRAVCQSDCSGIGYPKVGAVINLNGDLDDLTHYNRTVPLAGDIGANLDRLIAALPEADAAERRQGGVACRLRGEEAAVGALQARRASPPPRRSTRSGSGG